MIRISTVKGLTDQRRLPRLGKIRLGIKEKKFGNTGCNCGKNQTCFKCSYPKETEYFVCPKEVEAIYGEKPTSLDVMLVTGEQENIFPVSYSFYGASKGIKCKGDGEIAYRKKDDNKGFFEDNVDQVSCPCDLLDKGKCKQTGHLMVILPKVNIGGIYQITTSSHNSIVDVISGIEYIRSILGRSPAMIPLKLKRVPTKTTHEGKQRIHYTLQLTFEGSIDYINELGETRKRILQFDDVKRALPEPEENNPEFDLDEYFEKEGIKDEEPMEELNKKKEQQALMAEHREKISGCKTSEELRNYGSLLVDSGTSLSNDNREIINKEYMLKMQKLKKAENADKRKANEQAG